ncbi:C-type lectin domain family 7 member A-like [Toxotes jaculatrix]|uniref:C-type lectin domain family 7 member A-like n=1 Tax=Toxotes jaculatrix TaxID=941984 RepID=UPI001B3AAA33|nr:C-type lectin domain family 7 member A-like [Toxotes jaculatrix]
MENSQSQSEHEEEMSSAQEISQYFNTDGHLRSHRQAFGQGLFTKGGGSALPPYRLVILSLGLLNAVLLLAAVVIGIYCAKAKDLEIPYSAATPLIVEMNYLRNHSGIIRAKVEAEAALVRERASHLQLKLQVNQKKTLSDVLQKQIETLQTEKTNLKTNKTTLEQNCGRCLPGWILLKSSCYYFSPNELLSRKNWLDSRVNCISQGGDLLVINNLVEQQLLNDNLPHVSSSSSVWWQNGYWIGLTKAVVEETWVWVNNMTDARTAYWRNGQPRPSGSQSGNCAAYYYFSDAMKTWYNGDCHNHTLKWICEMEPNST